MGSTMPSYPYAHVSMLFTTYGTNENYPPSLKHHPLLLHRGKFQREPRKN
jgi:hypothetical protein